MTARSDPGPLSLQVVTVSVAARTMRNGTAAAAAATMTAMPTSARWARRLSRDGAGARNGRPAAVVDTPKYVVFERSVLMPLPSLIALYKRDADALDGLVRLKDDTAAGELLDDLGT